MSGFNVQRSRRRLLLGAASVAISAMATACATTVQQRSEAARRLDQVWAAENARTKAEVGSRVLNATPDQVHRAAKATMAAIGLILNEQASQPPNVVGSQTFAAGGWSWSQTVQKAEEARMRRIFIEVLGRQGAQLTVQRGDEVLTARVAVGSRTQSGTAVSLAFELSSPDVNCEETACLYEIPPAALRAGYFEFWETFDEELAEIQAEDAAKAAAAVRRPRPASPRRKPKRRRRPPSEWVTPPSGWKPPPRN